ncbi:uncharacterized protein H6S33_006195 [Morchella sextelata]|uniref:uncharacterized protein n=1 Tax=Morchella sextelata TaxID=1174677 RepID=UPI001D04BB40|nr:uncharacterized protein H6S33_006195 [Morchella sextelata]KAH0614309.1 hypothetical protein H6S33_006195 [Morchella sextelata]
MPLSPHPFSTNPLKTRADLHNALESFLNPLAHHTSPNGARIKIGSTATHYDETAAQLEGFARPLWGLASLLAGGGKYEGTERWIHGLAAGTDPESNEYWGETRARDQRMVEMSPIGFSLAVAPGAMWEPLGKREKENVVKWLNAINDKEMPNTNWLWFRVFANLGLSKVGAPFDPERLKADLDHLDTFYLGDGWSRDGPEGVRQLDYYSGSFAIQYAQLVYSKLAADTDPVRSKEYRDRARKYAADFVHMFDEEGRAIPFGRSTTYRMAMAAFWGAVAFADVELPAPLSWGVIKGILLRNLRWWSHQDIFSSDGTLSIGYCYPNMYFTENYNSPGSPYWGMKAFIPLALSESHPFWKAEELPYPSSQLPKTVALHHPSHIISHLGGHTFLLSSGQACHYPLKATQAKYGKFAYSSAFGFSVPTGSFGLDQHAADSMIAFSEDEGETWKTRRLAPEARIESIDGEPVLISKWFPWPDVEVETWLIPPVEKVSENWHLRVHKLKNPNRKIMSVEGAFAIYGQTSKDGRTLGTFDGAEGRFTKLGEAFAISSAGAVGILDMSPGDQRKGVVMNVDANANLMAARTVLPQLEAINLPKEGETWLVSAVFALPVRSGETSVKGTWEEKWEKKPAVPEWISKLMKQ